MSDRTHPVILDHLDAVVASLEAGGFAWPVGVWERPEDAEERFVNAPYALARVYPSTGQFDGPLSDSQVDIVVRIQVMGVGNTSRQAINITDLCRTRMKKSMISIPNRSVMDIRMMVVSGGVSRDDDLPTPYYYNTDLYELQTTPE